MGRHGKNQTASAVYGYHEKKKDTRMYVCNILIDPLCTTEILLILYVDESGYGSQSVRIGKDSQRVLLL